MDSIVTTYHGPSEELRGKVLRLRKRPLDEVDRTESSEAQDPTIDFVERIVNSLLPSQYTLQLHSRTVSPRFIKAAAELLEPLRPASRREAAGVDTASTFAVIAEDLVNPVDEGDVLSVEIKVR